MPTEILTNNELKTDDYLLTLCSSSGFTEKKYLFKYHHFP